MLDLNVDRLALHIDNAAGHEHRLRPITERALALMSQRLELWPVRSGQVGTLHPMPVQLSLASLSDEQAALRLADTLTEAIVAKLGV